MIFERNTNIETRPIPIYEKIGDFYRQILSSNSPFLSKNVLSEPQSSFCINIFPLVFRYFP